MEPVSAVPYPVVLGFGPISPSVGEGKTLHIIVSAPQAGEMRLCYHKEGARVYRQVLELPLRLTHKSFGL